MGRIKKAATERHTATASPFISRFVLEATSTPLHELPAKLDNFPQQWPFPRGDLYHWIALLDRFDHIFELFNSEYAFDKGPQQQPVECRLLKKGDAEDGMPYPTTGASQQELDTHGFTSEGDQQLVEHIVHFTRILLEHCGNRSLYNSSRHLDTLLNTTSLSLCQEVLRLGVRLAQRYQVARYKNTNPQAQQTLLSNHYHFTFDRLQKIANPFPKLPHTASAAAVAVGRSKDKLQQAAAYNPSDLVSIAKDASTIAARGDLASVHLTYYDQPTPANAAKESTEVEQVTPTPIRRTSVLGPSRDRPAIGERSATTGDVSSTPSKTGQSETPSNAPKIFQISSTKLANTPAWALVREAVSQVPEQSWDELLNKIRIATAFLTPDESGQQLLEIRLLAITNLAYALSESKFLEKIGLADSEEPKRFHLAQQLCDLLQPALSGQRALSLEMETCVLLTIEALAKSRHKASEVSDALQISHNHGLLYYELRKVMATLSEEEHQDSKQELRETEWREATFDLTNTLLQSNTAARHGERMVNAGIMAVLIEALKLRTTRAERLHEKILQFFDSFIHGISTAFQTLAGVKGLEVLSELMSYEVTSSLQNAWDGHGLPENFKSKVVDYAIPFYQQSTLRQLFKFIVHMFEHNAGTHDRLLRNLIDTPQVLGALRNVIENADTFGSNVWSGAVNIMSSFIHNEPTSFQVVGEAGLVKSLLQTIVPWELEDSNEDIPVPPLDDATIAMEYNNGELVYPTPKGILPVGETMIDIPTAFGAICLNESGTRLFRSSRALFKFMDIFVSPVHVKALEEDGSTAATIGQAFDELSRHHPQLKDQITDTVVAMVRRVNELCRFLAEHKGNGAKLWARNDTGIVVSGGKSAMAGPLHGTAESDVAEESIGAEGFAAESGDRVSGVPYISSCFRFLEGFFHNNVMCGMFCERGGGVHLLDLAVSASNPSDMVAFPVFSKITLVVKMMCEARPHLVLPSLVHQTQVAIAGLRPVMDSNNPEGAFGDYINLSQPQDLSVSHITNGTTIAKSLAMVHMLSHVLGRAFAPPQFTGRHQNQSNQIFTLVNFTDVYIELVDSLALLHAACVWENLTLQRKTPEQWKSQTEPKPYTMRRVDANGIVELSTDAPRVENPVNGENENASKDSTAEGHEVAFAIRNVKTLRYLLSQTPMGIEAFFHSLSQALVPKRISDNNIRQQAALVADHMAKAIVHEFEYKKFEPVDELTVAKARQHAVAFSTKVLLRSPHNIDSMAYKEALTLVLNKFYLAGGFEKLNECLKRCSEEVHKQQEGEALGLCYRDTLSSILSFYNQVVRSKTISEAMQSNHISVKNHDQADYFTSGQFVVEIRDTVLPALNELWHSNALEKLVDNQVKIIIESLRTILKGDGEDRAILRNQNATRRIQTTKLYVRLHLSADAHSSLAAYGYDEKLVREALYRCYGVQTHAMQYCQLRSICKDAPSYPSPDDESSRPTTSAATQTDNSTAADQPLALQTVQDPESVEMIDARAASTEAIVVTEGADGAVVASTDDNNMSDSDNEDGFRPDDALLSQLSQGTNLVDVAEGTSEVERFQEIINQFSGTSYGTPSRSIVKETRQPFVTLDDLDEKRDKLRGDLLDRCLEILSAQPLITFELAELIQAACVRIGEKEDPRADIGSTLVSSLLSLQAEEPSAGAGAKVAAYAHLVALILQDRDFFDSTLDELKENFDAFVSWLQLGQDQKAEDAPWIEMILLIVERVLVEDEQPVEIDWHAPPPDDPLQDLPKLRIPEPAVSPDLRSSVFDALVELLPKIGKNAMLALSVCRVLTILTRRRELATRMSKTLNMSGLFMMLRQLGGVVNDKIQSAIMMILRNMIEDDTIIRQIMRTEIRGVFETHRRVIDTTTYTRSLYHLILRDPQLFVETTGELVEIAKYDGQPHRGQALSLKKEKLATDEEEKDSPNAGGDAAVQKSVEGSAEPPKTAELKPPSVEVTDGVVQFLLRELSNYRDVDEKPATSNQDTQSATTNGDVQMADANSAPIANGISNSDANGTERSISFKPEDHVIYIYRCFLMQCLTELLTSYNRTKIEFINFSRKPESQITTPSKPRSGTLNYLLNVLIPVGTLEHRDDTAHRKKLLTSHWAMAVLTSLCARTPEKNTPRKASLLVTSEEDSDLAYVRKFVLEHALRAFKDATTSSEPFDQRYSRLLALSELFNRMLSNKALSLMSGQPSSTATDHVSSRQIGKLMYEKNFVGALTSAIAELDLNFPNAKRAVKYVLGPLKQLTDLGVTLSQIADLVSSTGETTEEDDISSATSISEEEDENREQTPDLYRNSTLGLFESGGGHDDDSEHDSHDDEDDMYDDGYDDEEGMDYEDGPIPDHDDVVSDEDEDIEGMGEVEGLPGDVEFEMDVVMDGEDDEVETLSEDSSDEEGDDDDDDEDDDHDDDAFDHGDIEEILGDDNASMPDHDVEQEWDEEDGALFEAAVGDDGGSPRGGPLIQIRQAIGADDGSDPEGVVQIDMDDDPGAYHPDDFLPDEMPPGDEDEDEDEEEIDFENDVVEFEGVLTRMRDSIARLRNLRLRAEDDEDEDPQGMFEEEAWEMGVPPHARGHHHHHHHRRVLPDMFGLAAGEAFRSIYSHALETVQRTHDVLGSGFRTYRTGGPGRGEEDGINPLLQRDGGASASNRDGDGPPLYWGANGRLGRRSVLTRGADFIQDLVNNFGPNGGHTINVSVGDGLPRDFAGHLPNMFAIQGRNGGQALIDIDPSRPWRDQIGIPRWADAHPSRPQDLSRLSGSLEEARAVDFRPVLTTSRWQEEARLLFGGKHLEKATRIINTLLRLLVPPAMEAKLQHDKAEAERKAAEDKAREEEKQKAEAEEAERQAREKEQREAREAEEARAREEAARDAITGEDSSAYPADVTTMEGVEQSTPTQQSRMASAPASTAPTERVTITIQGSEVDITNLGIDRTSLEELPEEFRFEALMGLVANQREQAAVAGEELDEINPEFLAALPAERRHELLRHEVTDRRRREQDAARQRMAENSAGQPAQAEEMNNADFMAMLDPALRQAILLDSDENTLAALPEDIQAEARNLLGAQRMPPGDQITRLGRFASAINRERAEQAMREASRQRRPVAQMLDKSGVATLLRLMFVSLHQKAKSNLHGILSDVCKNTQNRAEVISILLSILQDGTADVAAVERSFAHLSLRAKQLSGPKTPTPLKRTATGTVITPGAELSPLNIVQQCLGTLHALAEHNKSVANFFLNAHETLASQKTKPGKKGKARDTKSSKFPLNSLLTLLDRKLITENTGVMEALASLLSRITAPLLRKAAREDASQAVAETTTQPQDDQVRPTSSDVSMGGAENSGAQTADAPTAESSAITTDNNAESAAKDVEGSTTEASKEADKKLQENAPPDVPDENIRLVVNIITARECPAKTFTETLNVIKHLSTIPGAKEVFGKELVSQAQELSQAVLVDLEDLVKQINAAQTGTDLQGVALANFSSAASMQHKLLRVLIALDHLFDPKQTPEASANAEHRKAEPELKGDILAGLYESSNFEQLWASLSQCLTAIRKRGNMVNVAAILLPLIESLMVVCRNSSLKDIAVPETVVVGTPPPEARLDSLFFRFTEEHRKILNELIRNNPKLMNGNLAVLAKNSKVLEFDNKRNYFTRKLHTRNEGGRVAHPPLQLSVRRNWVFLDSFKSLYYKSGPEIKYGKLNIRFHNEEGIDAGGVSREWFAAMARQMFNPDYALFIPVASDKTTFHPNQLSAVNDQHLMYFKFIGRIIGKALYEGRVLDCHFSRAVYRRILGKSVSLKDMESLDLDYYKSLVWILENDITDITFETFSIDVERFGVSETVDLVPDGRNIAVTEDNKQEYVRLVVEHRLIKSVEEQLENFLAGFHDIIPPELISIFNEQELELLISGLPEIDVDDWKNNTEYHNYQASSPQIQWFWRAVRGFDKEEKAKLLQFVTGTSKVPLNGFKELEGMNGFSKFNIHRDYSSKEKLPSSHTCFNQLDLPEYESYEHLRQQLYTAITAGSEYFGFA